jgi:GGDEF domain-containing protein
MRSASGEILGCIAVGIDITDRKKSEDQVRYQAIHDALAGLANSVRAEQNERLASMHRLRHPRRVSRNRRLH